VQKTKKGSTTRKKSGSNSRSIGKKRPKNRREAVKNPNLDKTYNLKTRTKLLDQDYLHKLSPAELAWLDKFNAETINTDFDSKKLKKNLYATTKERKKELYDSNNARNRCVLTKQEAMYKIKVYDENLKTQDNSIQNLEILMDLQTGGFVDEEGQILDKRYKKTKIKVD
jgi:hypothetical protein